MRSEESRGRLRRESSRCTWKRHLLNALSPNSLAPSLSACQSSSAASSTSLALTESSTHVLVKRLR